MSFDDIDVPLGPQCFPSPEVVDFDDEPHVQLWEGEAYKHIFVAGDTPSTGDQQSMVAGARDSRTLTCVVAL